MVNCKEWQCCLEFLCYRCQSITPLVCALGNCCIREHWALLYLPVFFQGKVTFYYSSRFSVIYAESLWCSLLGEVRRDLQCVLFCFSDIAAVQTPPPPVCWWSWIQKASRDQHARYRCKGCVGACQFLSDIRSFIKNYTLCVQLLPVDIKSWKLPCSCCNLWPPPGKSAQGSPACCLCQYLQENWQYMETNAWMEVAVKCQGTEQDEGAAFLCESLRLNCKALPWITIFLSKGWGAGKASVF